MHGWCCRYCKKGEKANNVNAMAKLYCDACPDGTYQNSGRHRSTACIAQTQCGMLPFGAAHCTVCTHVFCSAGVVSVTRCVPLCKYRNILELAIKV